MRHLPNNKTERQKLIIESCLDYYGSGISKEERKSAKKIALWVMGRRKGISLTENEKSDVWAIKINLEDETYANSFPQ